MASWLDIKLERKSNMSAEELAEKLFLLRKDNLPKMQLPDAMIWEAANSFALTTERIDKVAKNYGFDAPTAKLFHAIKLAADYKKEELNKEANAQLEKAV